MIRLLISFCLFTTTYIHATKVFTVPERLFHMTGSEVNVSEGDLLYKSQASGYYTGGGGMVVRSPVKSTQFANASLPQIQAGCGGIDIYTGGFSFIDSKQLVEALQAIASNSAGYAFMLGLESVSPTIANTMRQMQSWANTINGIGINSCETAATLVGSVWPANDMASQHICRSVGTANNKFSSYVEGRHKCASLRKEYAKEIKPHLPLEGEYNIAWEALIAQPFFKDPKNYELAEMYMTLVGTIIVKEEEMPKFHFSKAESNEFLRKLLEGGKITKYKCVDRKKCLEVEEKEEEISVEDSWFAKVRKHLMSIQQKIKDDIPLDSIEKGLLSTSRLPLFKVVNVITAYHRGGPCAVDINEIADIVSWDVLAQIINEAIEAVRKGCEQIRVKSTYEPAKIDHYLKDLERIRAVVHRYEESAKKAIDLEMRLIQKMQLLEKQINSEIMVN